MRQALRQGPELRPGRAPAAPTAGAQRRGAHSCWAARLGAGLAALGREKQEGESCLPPRKGISNKPLPVTARLQGGRPSPGKQCGGQELPQWKAPRSPAPVATPQAEVRSWFLARCAEAQTEGTASAASGPSIPTKPPGRLETPPLDRQPGCGPSSEHTKYPVPSGTTWPRGLHATEEQATHDRRASASTLKQATETTARAGCHCVTPMLGAEGHTRWTQDPALPRGSSVTREEPAQENLWVAKGQRGKEGGSGRQKTEEGWRRGRAPRACLPVLGAGRRAAAPHRTNGCVHLGLAMTAPVRAEQAQTQSQSQTPTPNPSGPRWGQASQQWGKSREVAQLEPKGGESLAEQTVGVVVGVGG